VRVACRLAPPATLRLSRRTGNWPLRFATSRLSRPAEPGRERARRSDHRRGCRRTRGPSPLRSRDRRRREHECDSPTDEGRARPTRRTAPPPCCPLDDCLGGRAVAPDHQRLWPRYAWSGSPGGAGEAAALVFAIEESVANGGRRRSRRHRRNAASPGRAGSLGRVGQRGCWRSDPAVRAPPIARPWFRATSPKGRAHASSAGCQ
jgi:hypothetical protein